MFLLNSYGIVNRYGIHIPNHWNGLECQRFWLPAINVVIEYNSKIFAECKAVDMNGIYQFD